MRLSVESFSQYFGRNTILCVLRSTKFAFKSFANAQVAMAVVIGVVEELLPHSESHQLSDAHIQHLGRLNRLFTDKPPCSREDSFHSSPSSFRQRYRYTGGHSASAETCRQALRVGRGILVVVNLTMSSSQENRPCS